jgi:hypothetical protein
MNEDREETLSNDGTDHRRATTAEFIARHDITASCSPTDHNPNMDGGEKMDHWRVVLARPGARLTVYFSMGTGHHGKPPEPASVLDCLASDAASIENAPDFREWCAEFGYDTDSRKAHRTFKICQRQAQRLKNFLGDPAEYQRLLFETDRL